MKSEKNHQFCIMISINNIYYGFGERYIFEDASIHITPNDKIGLIGRNGKGKTTLLRLIVGDSSVESGTIEKSKDCKIGFLNQDLLSFKSSNSILYVAMEAFADALRIQSKIDVVLHKMETDYHDDLVEELGKYQTEFERLDGYTIQSKAEAVLEGLGFSTDDLKKPLNEFSGGWRMRVMLAKILLQNPSLLLLDEPTNHLDLPSIQWLENYLKSFSGAFILVSHDRQFLDSICQKTVEVYQRKLRVFKGNYSFYLREKVEQETIDQAAFENQQKYIKQQEKFIERFKAKASKATQAQSKLKALDKLDKLEAIESEDAAMKLRFKVKTQPGKVLLEIKGLEKSYGENIIIKNSDFALMRGDKIALIGANGKGKSTLLRIIADQESHIGKREGGYNVERGFFAQHQLESLDLKNDILTELIHHAPTKTEQELRAVLGCFLFFGDDVFKKIKVLSGGEKSRVALAKTLLTEANLLLLDEPTNHLDIQSVNVLIDAIKSYEGTAVIVSHDRHFIRETATKIWYIEDCLLKEYPGNFSEFEKWYDLKIKAPQKNAPNNMEKQNPKKEINTKSNTKEGQKEKSRLEKNIKNIEDELEKLETEKQNIESEMEKPSVFGNPEKLAELTLKFSELDGKEAQLTKDWEQQMIKFESFNQ